MRIAILNLWSISDNSIGGTERFVDDLSYSLAKKGNIVDVYMFSGKSFKKNNVNYISLDLFGKDIIADEYMICNKFGDFNDESSYDRLAKLLEEGIDASDYDFIHLNSHLFLKCFQNKKRIISMHSNYEEFTILWSNEAFELMKDILKTQMINNSLKVVCPSEYYANEWESILKEKVYCIPHAINLDRLNTSYSKEELISKYSLSDSKIKILLPSRLEMIQKRPKLVLEALKELTFKERSKFQVIFTGIDSQYECNIKELKDYSEKYNIDSKFIIFDHISEAYKICDLVCVPSNSESFGYSALEGIIQGIPTILSNIPTYKEFAKSNSNVYIFNDIEDFCNILKSFLNINIERLKVSFEYLDKFSLDTFGEKYIGLL